MLSTTQEYGKSLEELLFDLCSTPIGANMPSPQEILHNRTFQWPGKPSTPVDMECVCNFLLLRKQSQKQHFGHAHNARELQQLDPGQEVLYLSPAENEYIPRTIIDKASTPCSYIIEGQGKHYHRTREHTRSIHLTTTSLSLQSKPQQPSWVSKHYLHNETLPQPKQSTPTLPQTPFSLPYSHIARSQHPSLYPY